jgi:hypothetical protein
MLQPRPSLTFLCIHVRPLLWISGVDALSLVAALPQLSKHGGGNEIATSWGITRPLNWWDPSFDNRQSHNEVLLFLAGGCLRLDTVRPDGGREPKSNSRFNKEKNDEP